MQKKRRHGTGFRRDAGFAGRIRSSSAIASSAAVEPAWCPELKQRSLCGLLRPGASPCRRFRPPDEFGINAKYYAVDVGLRYHLLGGTARTDAGHIPENVVYPELLRREYRVKGGKINDREIDFVARKPGGQLKYYQVTQSVMDETTLTRELAPLQALNGAYLIFCVNTLVPSERHPFLSKLNGELV